eukprot:2359479-Pyramimonas_sp.AAC.1
MPAATSPSCSMAAMPFTVTRRSRVSCTFHSILTSLPLAAGDSLISDSALRMASFRLRCNSARA